MTSITPFPLVAVPSRAPRSLRRHIVVLAPPWYPVPPLGYGGIEVVVSLLTTELRARGHRVTLFAAEGSDRLAVVHSPLAWRADLGQPDERLRELTYAARVLESIGHRGAIDVIHDHVGFATLLGSVQLGVAPVLHTVHGSIREPDSAFYEALRGQVGLAAISESQRRSAPKLPWIGTVPNAVSVRNLTVRQRDDTEAYLLCLARICPDKGQHLAIEVARRTGLRLILAGKVDSTLLGRDYFHRQVSPAVDGDHVIHLANVSGHEKAWLLAHATALLAPIQWEEPFGLSVVEAMASGTPAISMARGSAPELIDEGLTGFLVHDVDEMVAAVRRADSIDPARCAALTRARFSPEVMADAYLRLYESVEASLTGRHHPLTVGSNAVLRLGSGQLQPGWLPGHHSDTRSPAIDAGVA
jgi:glycosyltransferase involved in cell wall biosynthesis